MISNDYFESLYRDFNARDIEKVLSKMHDDVKWANGMEGGFVDGRDAVRDYWTRQFAAVNSRVEPLEIKSEENKTVIKVHQLVKDLEENLISDSTVEHIFYLENGLVKMFEIGKADENLFKL